MKLNFTRFLLLFATSCCICHAHSQQTQFFSNNSGSLVSAICSDKYISFSVATVGNKVDLCWTIAAATNDCYFEVERSSDRQNFKTVAIVLDGFADAQNNKRYQFRENPSEMKEKQIIYYRLKQINVDGKTSYSVILATRNETGTGNKMLVSPNPFSGDFTIGFNANANAVSEIRLVNTIGQTVYSKQVTVLKGYNNIQVAGLDKFVPGIYMAELVVDGKIVETKRMVKN